MFKKLLQTILGLLIIPAAIGVGMAFYAAISNINDSAGILRTFERGMLVYFAFHIIVARPVYLYIVGHEVVHVIATWICGGKIVSFSVTPSGGNVVTSKTNVFIELSPYFVPIYTILLAPIFIVLKNIYINIPYLYTSFVFLIGVTMAFHFAMTFEALKLQQSDVMKSGKLFSYLVIFIGNLIIIMAVFSPLIDNLSFIEFLKSAWANSGEIYRATYTNIALFIEKQRT